jgi:hypothetical protein
VKEAEAAKPDAPEVEVTEALDQMTPGETAGDVEDSDAESIEGEKVETAEVPDTGETAGDVEDSDAESAEEEKAETAEVPDTEKPEPKAAEAVELTESAADEGTSAEEPVSSLNPEPTDSTAMRWGSRLRKLNPRSRR